MILVGSRKESEPIHLTTSGIPVLEKGWDFLKPKSVIRAAGYIRVSDIKQERNYSIAFQKAKILAYCRENNIIIREEHIFIDTYTGKVWRQRKDLQKALNCGKHHEFDQIIMYKLDRLSREPDDQIILREQFLYYGVKIVTLDPEEHADDDSLAGEIVRRVYAWKAKIERQDIIQRTHDGLEQRVKEGRLLVGRRPLYGYLWQDVTIVEDGREKVIPKAYYIICESQAVIVRRIFQMAKSGVSLRKIAFHLTEEKIPTPEGKELWPYQTVRNILGNTAYIGKGNAYKTRTEFIPGEGQHTTFRPESEWVAIPDATPPIIDVETFEIVQVQLVRNRQLSARNNPVPQETLLRCGMAVCASCGHNLSVDRGRDRGKTRTRYRCPNAHRGYKECQNSPDIAATLLDALVWKEAVRIIRNPSLLDEELARQKTSDPTKDELTAIDSVLADTIDRMKNLMETIETTTNMDSREVLSLRVGELALKKKGLEEKRDIILREKINWMDVQKALVDFKVWCGTVRPKMDNPTYVPSYEEKRNALERLGITVYVYPADHKPRIHFKTRPAELGTRLGG
jgi:site-specific DNA recombinase